MKESHIHFRICLPSHAFVLFRTEFFFPEFLRLCLRGLKDEKEGKKSPLVSEPRKQHLEPSCHPAWIKDPSEAAAESLYMVSNSGPVCGRGWRMQKRVRTPGLNKTSRSA